MRLDDVRDLFSWDGSLRDIYILKADLSTWHLFLAALPGWRWLYRYSEGGKARDLPATLRPFAQHLERGPLLEVRVGNTTLNCHFFSEDQIELDLDPRRLTVQDDLDQLLAFMRNLSDAVSSPTILTGENMPGKELISVHAAEGVLRWLCQRLPSPREMIFVALLNEGVDVWRPVEAARLCSDIFYLVSDQPYDETIEEWQFTPGTAVRCELRRLSDGLALVAVSVA